MNIEHAEYPISKNERSKALRALEKAKKIKTDVPAFKTDIARLQKQLAEK